MNNNSDTSCPSGWAKKLKDSLHWFIGKLKLKVHVLYLKDKLEDKGYSIYKHPYR